MIQNNSNSTDMWHKMDVYQLRLDNQLIGHGHGGPEQTYDDNGSADKRHHAFVIPATAMNDKAHWVQVAMGGKIPGPLTYGVPDRWCDQMQVGLPVLVPVGRRTERGWVVERLGEHDLPADVPPSRVKPVSALGAEAHGHG